MTGEKFTRIIVKSFGAVLITLAVYFLTYFSYWRLLLTIVLLIEGIDCVIYGMKKGGEE